MFARRRVVPLGGYDLTQRVRPGTTYPVFGSITGETVVPHKGYDLGTTLTAEGLSYPNAPTPPTGVGRVRPQRGCPGTSKKYAPPNRVPSVPALHPKSHDYTESHRRSPMLAKISILAYLTAAIFLACALVAAVQHM